MAQLRYSALIRFITNVEEIGLFATIINTSDNVKTMVGNGKIFSDTIQNFSANPYRRVELTAQLAHGVTPPRPSRC
jgi:small conductance mechanosensitive channel